jgi:hypothetical protein
MGFLAASLAIGCCVAWLVLSALPIFAGIRRRRYVTALVVAVACLVLPPLVGSVVVVLSPVESIADTYFASVFGLVAFMASVVVVPLFALAIVGDTPHNPLHPKREGE